MPGTSAMARRNAGAFRWLRAGVFALVTLSALRATGFFPGAIDGLLALTVGAASLFAPGIAVLAFAVFLAVPMIAADLITGAAFLVLCFAAVQYLGQDDSSAFVAIGLMFVGAKLGLSWAFVAVAGYVLGAAEGAVAALVACLAIEAAGVLLGQPQIGIVVTGGSPPAVLGFGAIADPMEFGWLADSVRNIDPGSLTGAFGHAAQVPLLIAQPLVWAAGAALAGTLKRPVSHPRRAVIGMAAVAGSVLLTGLGSAVASTVFGGGVESPRLVSAAAASLLAALVITATWEWVFPPIPVQEAAGHEGSATMKAEDADVDELLRLIASAEEELAAKHTSQQVVMITDMKSFSKMTEEEGSVLTAKLIQRHRDLLLPIVSAHGGHGKSTGGDGLVAAFGDPVEALKAATDMQRALALYNESKASEREMTIRIGIAQGEVVLDKGGRPFIGAALNMAARVMNLADGGQIMVSGDVADAANRSYFRTHSHGAYALKNISEPVEVVEILYSDGQQPKSPPLEA